MHEFGRTEVTCLRSYHSFVAEPGPEFRSLDPRLDDFNSVFTTEWDLKVSEISTFG